jgi:hypothetical protein
MLRREVFGSTVVRFISGEFATQFQREDRCLQDPQL